MSRPLLALLISALATLTSPQRVEATPFSPMKCCVQLKSAMTPNHCHREQAPAKSDTDRACCSACAMGLALWIAPSPFISPPREAEEIPSLAALELSRFDSPPVPPPRMQFF